ncbi:DUF4129 domain-containing protein [Arthrobacter castelli]|uniref:DUF4129 domain-containing protein n=1 Tax=Arthrobacter castelli TaxID=271431 RepID=UPI000478E915|nr:DUF4129 domain-containing protein [Arthrobacter castelli]
MTVVTASGYTVGQRSDNSKGVSRVRDNETSNAVLTRTVMLVLLALGLIVLGANSMGPIAAVPRFDIDQLRPPEPISEQIRPSSPATAAPGSDSGTDDQSLLPVVVMVAAGVIVLAGFAAVAHAAARTLYSARRRPVEDTEPGRAIAPTLSDAEAAQFHQHFDDAQAALLDPGATDNAVIRCWLSLERAAALAGSGRRLNQTPSEFTTTVLHAFDTDPGDTAVILRLYQRARYGATPSIPMKPDDLAAARTALESLRRDIEKHLPRSPAR